MAPTAAAWLAALDGADLVVRSGFDDDAMLRAAVRLGVPVVVPRARRSRRGARFRRHGPLPARAAGRAGQAPPPRADGGAAVAGTLGAAEARCAARSGARPRRRGAARHLAPAA